jgi:hypothetical protein
MRPREVAIGRLGGVNRRNPAALALQSAEPSETNSRRRPAAARNTGILIIDRARARNRFEDISRVRILRWTRERVITSGFDYLDRYLIIQIVIYFAPSIQQLE